MSNYITHHSGAIRFRSFVPDSVQTMVENMVPASLSLLSDVDAAFQRLNSLLRHASPEALAEITRTEAAASVRLASVGTDALSVLLSSAQLDDVANLIAATEWGVSQLDYLPIATRLISQVHAVALSAYSNNCAYPGELRTTPVWIGSPGCTPSTARFVPPLYGDMTAAINSLEQYIHHHSGSPFVKAAVIHYYFEMIHPFVDGNGRVGRVLNTLYLFDAHALAAPSLLLSSQLLAKSAEYYSRLQQVNRTGQLHLWVEFFLTRLKEAAEATADELSSASAEA